VVVVEHRHQTGFDGGGNPGITVSDRVLTVKAGRTEVHIVALVESAEHVCCRYRLAAFQPFIEKAGHTLELRPWPRSWWSRLTSAQELGAFDVVIVQRRLLPDWQLRLLRRHARRLVFDFDDAVFLRDSYAAKGAHSGRRCHRFTALAGAADLLIAGNPFLAGHASRCSRAGVATIPTCVEPARYPLAKHCGSGADVQLAWIGSSSTLRGLEMIRPLLERVGRNCPGMRLKIICDRFLDFDQLPVVPCPWSEEREASDLAGSDIGISWLPDDQWSRGKCGLKVLQYMAAGLPVVANPVGVQSDLIRHGESGFLADTPEEWVEALAMLAGDPELRRQMGHAGRQRVEDEYSVRRGASKLVAVLEKLAAQPDRVARTRKQAPADALPALDE
jgi:glycosyltransferase involved in cell wall biosynthesis